MVKTIRVSAIDQFYPNFEAVATAEHGERRSPLFILFFGTEDPITGKSWCPDSIVADPLIRYAFNKYAPGNSVLIEAPVGNRSEWRQTPDHPYKTDSRIKLLKIPTLVKWTSDPSTDQRLIENECALPDKLAEFFTVSLET
ncbi:hypothetical protein G9A89_008083 [Geosiphon pyriformis]|nr:hypothetical protein G9A89_008083 [Geosiphon pyriformis]